jgi:hypothetical protein
MRIAIEDGDVVRVEAKQLESGLAVTCDIRRDRVEA